MTNFLTPPLVYIQSDLFSYSSYLKHVNLSGNRCTPYPDICDGTTANYGVLQTCACV